MTDIGPKATRSARSAAPATACTVAVDLGGTNVRAAAVDRQGSILVRRRIPTPRSQPTPQFLVDLIREVAAEVARLDEGAAGVDQVVVGLPGVIDQLNEQLITGVNLPQQWVPLINEDWIAEHVGLEVSLANDADLAAVGESEFGAGRNLRDVVYVTISTGVGAGMVVNGRLVQGSLSGGELGHTVIDWPAAERGEPATVEDLGSGTAIERRAAAAGLVVRGADLAEAVRRGEEPARTIWTRAIGAVGIGVANMAWILSPQIVIVGGGVGVNGDIVLPVLRDQLRRYGPGDGPRIELAVAELGDDAALIGAAAWWRAIGRSDSPEERVDPPSEPG
ncbi:MAG: ROK family protein [Acidimicrobiia bacterium]|nr:ROK family protein [Acidimicrobiia bacterium]